MGMKYLKLYEDFKEEDIIFVRTKKFNNNGTTNSLPYSGIQCWAIYGKDLEKYIIELELWGGRRKDVEIINTIGYNIFALDYQKAHKFVMGEISEPPELEIFDKQRHILLFVKQDGKSILEYIANIEYQVILQNKNQ